jgi:hypothetical protein
LFSEPLARLVFWLFLLLSIPVGLHHQYLDPSVPQGWKVVHAVLTYSLFIPSLLTAFNVIASLELGGRARGGTGLLGWIRTLPWDNPVVYGAKPGHDSVCLWWHWRSDQRFLQPEPGDSQHDVGARDISTSPLGLA